MRVRHIMLLSILALSPQATVWGQVQIGPQGPMPPAGYKRPVGRARAADLKSFDLTLDPAAEPVPALKYSFVPGYLEQTPGNAVSFYYRAILMFTDMQRRLPVKERKLIDQWLKMPLDKLPLQHIRDSLHFRPVYEELKTAAYREKCDWDWRLRDQKGNGAILFSLKDTHQAHLLARYLVLKARVEIAQGRYDDAIETLRIGFSLARDIARQEPLISNLIGISIARMMCDEVRELIDAPGAPNLYWALAQLPDPLIDLRQSIRHEMAMPLIMFPFLKDAETAQRSPEQWQRLIVRAATVVEHDGTVSEQIGGKERWTIVARILAGYPNAKRRLMAAGYSREQVEQMPVGQVVAIDEFHTFRMTYDAISKWVFLAQLSFPKKQRWMMEAVDNLRLGSYLTPRPDVAREVIPIARALLPIGYLYQAIQSQVRLEAKLAGLRTLEAIRMFAVRHGPTLPNALDEIKVVPVPRSPYTGKPFPYRVQGKKAVLDIPLSETFPGELGTQYHITIAPSKPKPKPKG